MWKYAGGFPFLMSSGGGGGGGDGGAGGTQPGGDGGGGAPAVPWAATDGNAAPWSIGDKPWYEVAIEGDDDTAKGTRDFLKAKNYRDPSVAARSLYELNRANEHLKATAVVPPGENATPEETAAFYKRLGRPDTVDGYKDVKWGENADPRMVEFGAKLAYDLGIPPSKAESVLAKSWNEFIAQTAADEEKNAAAHVAEEDAKLRAAWGDAYDTNIAQGKRVLDALRAGDNGITEQDLQAIEQSAGTLPLLKLLGTIGKLTSEGGFMGATGGMDSEVANLTPEQAKTKFEQNMSDPEFHKKYTDKYHADHKSSVAMMEALAKRAGNAL